MGLLVAAVELVGFDGTDDGDLVAGAGLVGPGGRGDELDGALRGGDHEQALGAVVGVAVNGQVGDHGPGDGQFLPFLPEPLVGCRLLPVGQIEGSVESLVGRNGRAEQPQLARPDGGGTQRGGEVRFVSVVTGEVFQQLGDRLNTRVKVTLGASKGQIVIDFATVADLNRILGELGQPGFRK